MTHNVELNTNEGLLEFEVSESEDGTITLMWDHDHPTAIELGINDWSDQEWIQFLTDKATEFVFEEESKASD
jgi:hypothetical protein